MTIGLPSWTKNWGQISLLVKEPQKSLRFWDRESFQMTDWSYFQKGGMKFQRNIFHIPVYDSRVVPTTNTNSFYWSLSLNSIVSPTWCFRSWLYFFCMNSILYSLRFPASPFAWHLLPLRRITQALEQQIGSSIKLLQSQVMLANRLSMLQSSHLENGIIKLTCFIGAAGRDK